MLIGWLILDGFFLPTSLEVAEGRIVDAKWVGLKHPRFVVRLGGHPQFFQVGSTADLRRIAEVTRPGRRARIGHTDDRVSFLNDNIRVYSLAIDGQDVFTLDDYRAKVRSDRPGLLAIFTIAVILAAVGFMS